MVKLTYAYAFWLRSGVIDPKGTFFILFTSYVIYDMQEYVGLILS